MVEATVKSMKKLICTTLTGRSLDEAKLTYYNTGIYNSIYTGLDVTRQEVIWPPNTGHPSGTPKGILKRLAVTKQGG